MTQPLLNRADTLRRALDQIDAHFNNPNTERKQYFAAKAAGTLPDPDQELVDLLPEETTDDDFDPWDLI